MDNNEFALLVYEACEQVRAYAPKRTGNLAYNAVKVEQTNEGEWTIFVDEEIAPYMVFTNEPWGKGTNPNEGWFDRVAEVVAETIQARLGADIKR